MTSMQVLRALVVDVTTSVEAAIAAGNTISHSRTELSEEHMRLMGFLHEAAEMLDRIGLEWEAGTIVGMPARRRPELTDS